MLPSNSVETEGGNGIDDTGEVFNLIVEKEYDTTSGS
jgi:hypothetical protein